MPLLLRPEDAAIELNIGRTRVYQLMAQGRLESLKLGKRRLIPADAIVAFIERERQAQAAETGR